VLPGVLPGAERPTPSLDAYDQLLEVGAAQVVS
jgi:hypothetical protein